MKLSSLLKISSQITEVVYKSPKPADAIVSEFMRKRKNLGSKERRFISECVFSSLRNFLLLEYLCGNLENEYNSTDKKFFLICACNVFLSMDKDFSDFASFEIYSRLTGTTESDFLNFLINAISIETNVTFISINNWLSDTKSFVKNLDYDIKHCQIDLKKVELRYSFPVFLLNEIERSGLDAVGYAAQSVHPAKVNLRVNLQNSSFEEISKMLSENAVPHSQGKISPSGIILQERAKVDSSDEYRNGKFEVQDEGSQLIGFACNPKATDLILDACAGAGGKSIHLADLTFGKADIVATDTEFNRLKILESRAKRAGYTYIRTQHIKHPNLNYLKSIFRAMLFDIVLVDAPCSGMGTIRRDPLKKLRLNEKLMDRLALKQYRILTDYAHFVKPGGRLIYATCSVLPSENIDNVERFLGENKNFEADSLKTHFDAYDIFLPDISDNDYTYTTKTYLHGCDGFFIASMRRIY